MAIELNYMEYATAFLAQAAYPSSDAPWNILDEDCADISDWTDGDTDTAVSEVSPAGQFRFDTNAGAAGNAVARRHRNDMPSAPNRFTLRIRTYFDAIGLEPVADEASVEYQTATWRLQVAFASDGLFVRKAGNVYGEVGTNIVKHGGGAAWQVWDFVVDKTGGEAAATVAVYLDGVYQGTFDCDFVTAGVAGRVRYTQRGYATNNMVSHVDYIQIGTHNLQCYSESSIKQQGSYSLKGVALITNSLNDTLSRTVSPVVDLSNMLKIKFDIRASRTGSNIKIGLRDSGGTTTELTPNITLANTWQVVEWNISGVSNANKDAIDRIIVTIVNAGGDNTFYLDNLRATGYSKVLSEQIALTDSFSRIWTIYRSFTETIALIDTVSAFRIFYRVFTEILTLSDTIKKKIGKTLSEQISLSDVFSRRWTIYRTYTETISLADSVAKKVAKTFTESISLSDILLKKISKTFLEAITLTDTLKKRVSKTFVETLTLSDAVSKRIAKLFTETLHLTDAFSKVVSYYRTFTEKITLTDKVKVAKSNLVNLIKKLIHLEDIED